MSKVPIHRSGGEVMNLSEIVELLECAKINADNIKKAGIVFVDVVKMQIDEAIKLLESEGGEMNLSDKKVSKGDHEKDNK
jgi:hypothetical protein